MGFDPLKVQMVDSVEDRKHDRIRWHARRGLLENDLFLTRFLDLELAAMNKMDMALLEELLRWSDNDLLDVLMDRKPCGDPRFQPLIERIKAAQK